MNDLEASRRWAPAAIGAAVLVLVVAIAAAVTWTQRTDHNAQISSSMPDAGASTSTAREVWLWSGPSLCQSQRARGTALMQVGLKGTRIRELPLLTVSSLAAIDDAHILAVGRDARCRPAALASSDGGAAWTVTSQVSGRSIAAASDGTTWSLPLGDASSVTRRPVNAAARTVQVKCPAPTSATLISAADGLEAWVLCQDDLGLQRTLLHTGDGGESWDVPANELSNSGLAGVGIIRTLDLHLRTAGWLLKPARRCPEGELRTTTDGGNTWTDLPCPRDTVPVSNVLTVRFVDSEHGFLVGVRGSRAVLAATSDGGRTWRLTGSQAPAQ